MASNPSRRIESALAAYHQATDPVDGLLAARRLREAAEILEDVAVKDARAARLTWSEIGEVFGLTKQGAQQRFKRSSTSVPPEPRRRRQTDGV